jgi:hypothetical protein
MQFRSRWIALSVVALMTTACGNMDPVEQHESALAISLEELPLAPPSMTAVLPAFCGEQAAQSDTTPELYRLASWSEDVLVVADNGRSCRSTLHGALAFARIEVANVQQFFSGPANGTANHETTLDDEDPRDDPIPSDDEEPRDDPIPSTTSGGSSSNASTVSGDEADDDMQIRDHAQLG